MSLDKKRKELEYMRVLLAKQEMELKIEERLEEISRLKEYIKVQDAKLAELTLEKEKN